MIEAPTREPIRNEPPEPRRPASRGREPAVNVPVVIVVVCAVLFGIHALRLLISNESDNWLVAQLAFIPARITDALYPSSSALVETYRTTVAPNPILSQQIGYLMGDGQTKAWTLLTYALLHGSWSHVGFNCLWLVAFGSAVARRFSTTSFLLLLCLSAIAGAMVQWLSNYASFELVIGASASVSGAMGAAVRFVFRPSGEPRQIFDRRSLNEAYRLPGLSLSETFANRTALIFIVFWFAADLLFGLFPSLSGMGDAPVAWQAHIGGFLVGLLAFPLFDRRRAPVAAPVEREDSADLGAAALPPDA